MPIAEGRIGTIEYVSCQFASIVRELYRGNPEPYRDILDYAVNPPDLAPMPIRRSPAAARARPR